MPAGTEADTSFYSRPLLSAQVRKWLISLSSRSQLLLLIGDFAGHYRLSKHLHNMSMGILYPYQLRRQKIKNIWFLVHGS